MSLRQREVARRLYAKELNESTLVYKEHEDTYAPQYLLTPTGAKWCTYRKGKRWR